MKNDYLKESKNDKHVSLLKDGWRNGKSIFL